MAEIEKNEWINFVTDAHIKPPFYLGGIDNFLIRNSILSPVKLVFSPKFFVSTERGTLHISMEHYAWSFKSGGVTDDLKQRSEWKSPVLLQDLLKLDVDLRSEKDIPVFQQAERILWGTFSNLIFATESSIKLRLGTTFINQHYLNGLPSNDTLVSDAQHSDTGLIVRAKLNKEWFPELPFDFEKVKQSIPERLTKKIDVVWLDDFNALP